MTTPKEISDEILRLTKELHYENTGASRETQIAAIEAAAAAMKGQGGKTTRPEASDSLFELLPAVTRIELAIAPLKGEPPWLLRFPDMAASFRGHTAEDALRRALRELISTSLMEQWLGPHCVLCERTTKDPSYRFVKYGDSGPRLCDGCVASAIPLMREQGSTLVEEAGPSKAEVVRRILRHKDLRYLTDEEIAEIAGCSVTHARNVRERQSKKTNGYDEQKPPDELPSLPSLSSLSCDFQGLVKSAIDAGIDVPFERLQSKRDRIQFMLRLNPEWFQNITGATQDAEYLAVLSGSSYKYAHDIREKTLDGGR